MFFRLFCNGSLAGILQKKMTTAATVYEVFLHGPVEGAKDLKQELTSLPLFSNESLILFLN